MTRIVTTPGVCGGEPRIDGTRITVADIRGMIRTGMSPESIVEEYPPLTLDDITAAEAYKAQRKRRRHSWQDERRVRRMAVLLLCQLRPEGLYEAKMLDDLADSVDDHPDWQVWLKAAAHYLRELGRTRT
ncbi:MAG: DUF433 domain-containing protein [Coriobacteriia bacterium]